MNLACVIGSATATVKHSSLNGWRMLIVQPLDANYGPDGGPLIAIDSLGSCVGQRVMITSDGSAVRDALGANDSPVRWLVLGQIDE